MKKSKLTARESIMLVLLVVLLIVVMGLALVVRFGRRRRTRGAGNPRAPAPDDAAQ